MVLLWDDCLVLTSFKLFYQEWCVIMKRINIMFLDSLSILSQNIFVFAILIFIHMNCMEFQGFQVNRYFSNPFSRNNKSCFSLRYANFKIGMVLCSRFIKDYKFLQPLEGLNGKPLACKNSYIMLNSLDWKRPNFLH